MTVAPSGNLAFTLSTTPQKGVPRTNFFNSVANIYGCYTVVFTLQGIISCGILAAKAMLPISNFEDLGKVPYYVTRPVKINQILVLDGALQIRY